MGDSAGQPADRLHLLALAQGLLGLFPLHHLLLQQAVGPHQIGGAVGELAVGAAQRPLRHGQDDDDERRQPQHQQQAGVTAEPLRGRGLQQAQMDGAQPLPGLLDRPDHVQAVVLEYGGAPLVRKGG